MSQASAVTISRQRQSSAGKRDLTMQQLYRKSLGGQTDARQNA